MRRGSAQKGLSYVDQNRHCMVTIEDDVLGIKREILERWPGFAEGRVGSLNVEFDKDSLEWVVIQIERDGTQSMVFSVDKLDQRVIERLERADQNSRSYKPFDEEIDEHNEKLEAERERRFTEQIHDIGERLVHAFHKDGLIHRPKVFISNKP